MCADTNINMSALNLKSRAGYLDFHRRVECLLILGGFRRAYLIDESYCDPKKVPDIIEDIHAEFPKLHVVCSCEISEEWGKNLVFVTRNTIYPTDISNTKKLGELLGFPGACDLSKFDRRKNSYSARIKILHGTESCVIMAHCAAKDVFAKMQRLASKAREILDEWYQGVVAVPIVAKTYGLDALSTHVREWTLTPEMRREVENFLWNAGEDANVDVWENAREELIRVMESVFD